MSLELLALAFLCIALLYSAVGFGGGSSYIALLLLSSISYKLIPSIALICNLIVVTAGAYHYIKKGHLEYRFIFPLIVTSIPMAYLGGQVAIKEEHFRLLLGFLLLLAGLRMLFLKKNKNYDDCRLPPLWAPLFLGATLGLVSGLVGIGGGIFLSPILFNLKWGRPKQISATCCLFIFFNSLSGLLGQFQQIGSFFFILDYWPLLLAVFAGGQIGSFIGVVKLRPRPIEIGTAFLVLMVSLRILSA